MNATSHHIVFSLFIRVSIMIIAIVLNYRKSYFSFALTVFLYACNSNEFYTEASQKQAILQIYSFTLSFYIALTVYVKETNLYVKEGCHFYKQKVHFIYFVKNKFKATYKQQTSDYQLIEIYKLKRNAGQQYFEKFRFVSPWKWD